MAFVFEQDLYVVLRSLRRFGVDWYPCRYYFHKPQYFLDGEGGFDVRPVEPPIKLPAEWWRRIGYCLLALDWK